MDVQGCDIKYGKDRKWYPVQIKMGIHNKWKNIYIKGGVNNIWEPKKLPDFDITLQAGENVSSVIGTGTYELNSEVTITCILPKLEEGFSEFDGWYEGNKKVSSDQNYTFIVKKDIKLIAKAIIKYTINLIDSLNNETYGKININGTNYSGNQTITVPKDSLINFYCSSSGTTTNAVKKAIISENGTNKINATYNSTDKTVIPAEYIISITSDIQIKISNNSTSTAITTGLIKIQTVKLAYTFNDIISIPTTAVTYNIKFTINNSTAIYSYIYLDFPTSSTTGRMRYRRGSSYTVAYNDNWKNENYKKITFNEIPSNDLLTWLKANATSSFS